MILFIAAFIRGFTAVAATAVLGITAYATAAQPEVFPYRTTEVGITGPLSTGNFNETATLDTAQIDTGTACPNVFWDDEAGEFWCKTGRDEWTPPVNWDGETNTTPFDCEVLTTETEDGVTYSFCDG